MTDARHDELLDHGFGSRGGPEDVPDVIAMGPARDDIEVDDIEVIEMGPASKPPRRPPAVSDEVPPADAWEQELPVDPDAPPRPAPRVGADPEVSPADAWEQAQPTDRYDDY